MTLYINSLLDLLYQQSQITLSYRNRVCKISSAETKILIILGYYALFTVVSLSYFAVASAKQDELIHAIRQYFVCEGAGSQMECNRSEIEQFTYPGVIVETFVLFGFLPCVNLVYVINWRAIKKFYLSVQFKPVLSDHRPPSSLGQTVITRVEQTVIIRNGIE